MQPVPLELGKVLKLENKRYDSTEEIAITLDYMILVETNGCESLSAGALRAVAVMEVLVLGVR